MMTKLDLVQVKPRRVVAYLMLLAKYAKEIPEEKIKIKSSNEDIILTREKEFRETVQKNVDEIDKKITKSFYRLNSKLTKAENMLAKGKSGTGPIRPKIIRKINVIKSSFGDEKAKKLTELHELKQKIRLMEDKLQWLSDKGQNSEKMLEMRERVVRVKEKLYIQLAALLEYVSEVPSNKKNAKIRKDIPTKPPKEVTGNIIGNLANGRFHRPQCRAAKGMALENKIAFSSSSEAIKKAFTPCRLCFPNR